MRVTSKGQVTIPRDIRERLGIGPNSEVQFVMQGDSVVLRLSAPEGSSRGSRLVRRLRGRASVRMSTDEIMALTRGE
ncbi:MAG: AbrB/MazE/SpoVT family DNA-binding domain-containing protein [Nitrococcus sp.]|nr:AbrB/MazE/SpoVT family DNA-binding domain-containing protein [Nitrococcus sp.]